MTVWPFAFGVFISSSCSLHLVSCALFLVPLPAMKEVFKIGSSDELNPSQAILLLEAGESHCCFGIVDYANRVLVQAGYYTAVEPEAGPIMQRVIEARPELKKPFRQTAIGYYVKENILLPAKFYHFEEVQTLLCAMYDTDQNVAISEAVPEWQLFNAYNVPQGLHQVLSRHFATGNFWHAYSITLKNGTIKDDSDKLLIEFQTDCFSVIAIKNNTLLLAQLYPYVRAEDILYWLLKICKESSLSQDTVNLILSGLIDNQSAALKKMYQYFANIEFSNPENGIRLSADFSEYPVHFFSSLFNLASCVS